MILVWGCRNVSLRITDFHSTWTQEHVELYESVDSMYYIKHGRTYLYSVAVFAPLQIQGEHFAQFATVGYPTLHPKTYPLFQTDLLAIIQLSDE